VAASRTEMSGAAKLRYVLAGVGQKLRRTVVTCPSCSSHQSHVVAAKHLVTELHRCLDCRLLYRSPVTPAAVGPRFYDESYMQGFTTELPDDRRLKELLTIGFRGTEKDYSSYISVLRALGVGPGARLFDFGCSWGYGTWQLQESGFVTEAFEISVRRARYARRALGLNVVWELPAPRPVYDVFFSAHVLEHVGSVAEAVTYGLACLRSGGLFVAFTPNGSEPRRRADGWRWDRAWGMVHPNFLDDVYYRSTWGQRPSCLASDPYELGLLQAWTTSRDRHVTGDLSGDELMFVCA